MTIQLNGKSHQTQATTISQLLQELDLEGRPLVVEHQQKALLPKEYPSTPLTEGDAIEFITIVAGG